MIESSTHARTHELKCMEVWGGNGSVNDAVSTPGFDIFLKGNPYEGDSAGGDVHYLSMCMAGHITRFALCDVSGHGLTASDSASRLRKLVRKHINTPDQSGLVRALNEDVLSGEEGSRFATAVLSTYYAPAKALLMTIAGHPCPLWWHAKDQRWSLIGPEAPDVQATGTIAAGRNLPLGIIDETDFSQLLVPLEPGDIVVIYTDALIEAPSPAGKQLGEDGLLSIAPPVDQDAPYLVTDDLISRVRQHAGGTEFDDDVTVLALHHTGAEPPTPSITDRIATIGRALGLIS